VINRMREQDRINLLIVDIVCLITSFVTAFWIRFGITYDNIYKISYGFILILLVLCYICIFTLNDFYAGFTKRGFFDEFINVVKSNIILALIISAI
jgi:membrane protein YdbS with pleckstrin-like domain